MKPRASIDEARLRQLWADGVTTAAIGAEFGVTKNCVSERARRIGLRRRNIAPGSLPATAIEAAYREGKTLEEIKDELRPLFPTLSRSTINRLLRSRGVSIRPATVRTADNRAQCVRLFRAGVPRAEIARRLGMTLKNVQRRIRQVLGPGRKGMVSRFDRSEVLALQRAGLSQREIGERIGCSAANVWAILNRRGGARAVAS